MDDMDKVEQLLRDLGEINEKFIEEADSQIAQAPKRKISWHYFGAAAACIAVVAILVNMPEKNIIDIPPADQQVTTMGTDSVTGTESSVTSVTTDISENVTSEVSGTGTVTEYVNEDGEKSEKTEKVTGLTEKKQPENSSTIRPAGNLTGTGAPKNSSQNASTEKSHLRILNRNNEFYSVDGGYYQLHFLSDTDFQNKINQDIIKASDEIAKFYDPGYLAEKDGSLYPFDWVNGISNSIGNNTELEAANGIAMELICENGYLSIALGYLDCDGYSRDEGGDYGYERYWDVVRTLNYDIIGQKKIEKFTDLFYEGTDVLSLLNSTVFGYFENDKVSAVTDYPEYFTIHYILQNNRGAYYNDYTTLQYNSREFSGSATNSMIMSEYRDMSGVINGSIAAENLDDEKVPEFMHEAVTEDGVVYSRIYDSLYHSAEEIEKLNNDIKIVEHKAVEKYAPETEDGKKKNGVTYMKSVRPVSAESAYKMNGLWAVVNVMKEMTYYYDKETLEEITVKDLFGENWNDYVTNGVVSENTVISGLLYIENDELVFQSTGISMKAPLGSINQKYFS